MQEIHLSVRALVEFTLHGEDIRFLGGSAQDMLDGTLGHKARQKVLGDEDWQSEVPLSLRVEEEDFALLLGGRMDAFREGTVPLIEEIKLWQGKEPPESPTPAHRMQAVCYGHMLCVSRGLPEAAIRVVYVTRGGVVRGQFEERLTAEDFRLEFLTVLLPYVRRTRLILKHRLARDASLRTLGFPFGSYRKGQREMAVQVYTAVKLRRRLFASLPTGTGKSVAALFPALKALGEGLTGQVWYLTARTTQRQGAWEAVARMRQQPLSLWSLTIDAKDKVCPDRTLCHPDWCPRAKGHFLRDAEAIEEMMTLKDWTPEVIRAMAEKHCLCPFEFSMSLAEVADAVICDYNYALDPAVHVRRIFDGTRDVTLLIDEAHNLPSRLRDMLSGAIDTPRLRRLRTVAGKAKGRKHPLYQAMTELLKAVDNLPIPGGESEGTLAQLPSNLDAACLGLAEAFGGAQQEHFPWEEAGEKLSDTLMPLLAFNRARARDPADYAWLFEGKRHPVITAFALETADFFREATAGLSGVICFSATLHPLAEMKRLLGGEEEDACFALPSPFPPEHLTVLQRDINTRYRHREAACAGIVRAIEELIGHKEGKYIAFFPSFAFLRQVSEELSVPHQCQRPGMTEEERAAFLAPYRQDGGTVLSLCVLGGIFAEGIDLPGNQLDGVAIIGVGLPQVGLRQELLRERYEQTLGNGFFYAYMLPGMQKVTQAVGRVIRTETDRGVALLLDDRYRQEDYRYLMPEHWRVRWQGGAEFRLLP